MTVERASVSQTMVRGTLAEFVGTALFVFTGCLSGLHKDTLIPAAAHGLMILVLVTTFGSISGGHFNPAVSVGLCLSGHVSPIKCLLFVSAQILGSLAGSLLVWVVETADSYQATEGGIVGIGESSTVFGSIVCEILLTYILVQTVLITAADSSHKSKLAPVAIGLAVSVGILAGAKVSGGCMNPARALGPAVARSLVNFTSNAWSYHYVFWLGPLAGACLAALTYKLIFGGENHRWIFKQTDISP